MKRVLLIAGLLLSCPLFAADGGAYLYGSAGLASSDRKAQVDATLTAAGITAFTSSADDTDAAFKLQAGWRLNRYFAVEGGYVDLGRYTYQARSTAPVVATRDGHVSIDAWNLGVVASAPLSDALSLFAKAGVLAYKLKFSCSGTGIPCTSPDRSDSGTPLYYGVGAAWSINPHWFVRAEYEVFPKIGESFNANGTTGTSRADVNVGSIGIGYRF